MVGGEGAETGERRDSPPSSPSAHPSHTHCTLLPLCSPSTPFGPSTHPPPTLRSPSPLSAHPPPTQLPPSAHAPHRFMSSFCINVHHVGRLQAVTVAGGRGVAAKAAEAWRWHGEGDEGGEGGRGGVRGCRETRGRWRVILCAGCCLALQSYYLSV